jgi:hypothetical protein
MLTGTLNNIRRERAELARDIEYIREDAEASLVDDRLNYLERKIDYEDLLESANSINQIPKYDDFSEAEVTRILESDHDLSFGEMTGVLDRDGNIIAD